MTKNEIEKIKKAGLEEYLFKEINEKLWDGRKALERANNDRCKNFVQEIEKAKVAINDAEQLFEEIKK
jgi:hypothetical protein